MSYSVAASEYDKAVSLHVFDSVTDDDSWDVVTCIYRVRSAADEPRPPVAAVQSHSQQNSEKSTSYMRHRSIQSPRSRPLSTRLRQ